MGLRIAAAVAALALVGCGSQDGASNTSGSDGAGNSDSNNDGSGSGGGSTSDSNTAGSTGGAAFGERRSGEATYYAADGGGACLFDPSPDDLMVAAINAP